MPDPGTLPPSQRTTLSEKDMMDEMDRRIERGPRHPQQGG
jgi:hypothetical protein